MLDIMSEIDKVCTENSITYTIGGGTLLGAVRHKGFIPWDDDIDVFIERADYDKLIALLRQSDCDWLSILDDNVEGYYYPFAKAVDNRTVAKSELSATKHGIWVDIFPMENVPDNRLRRKIFLKCCQFFRAVIIAMTTDFSAVGISGKGLTKHILDFMAKAIGYKRTYKIISKFMRKHNASLSECEAVAWTPYGREYIEKSLMQDVSNYDFEDKKFKGITNYDIYLQRTYGDYMQLPPENKRQNHQVTAYWI